jgi:hypothetical protein
MMSLNMRSILLVYLAHYFMTDTPLLHVPTPVLWCPDNIYINWNLLHDNTWVVNLHSWPLLRL